MRLSILVVAMALVAAGCGAIAPAYDRCDKPAPYANAEEAPPLVVPEGVEAPNTRNALRIPEITAVEKPLDGRCVDTPPSFVTTRAAEQG